MIQVRGLHIAAGAFHRDGISFQIDHGQYAILMGRTGSGKTTMLETICGLIPALGGEIHLNGREVSKLKAAERGIGYVPQDRVLFNNLTVRGHLSLALEARRWSRKDQRRRIDELAEMLRLGDLLDRKPYGLSGGEGQRVSLGRALSFRPHILCLDEPLSSLDEENWNEVCELLRDVQRQTEVTTLHVTHSNTEAERLGDVVLKIEELTNGQLKTQKYEDQNAT